MWGFTTFKQLQIDTSDILKVLQDNEENRNQYLILLGLSKCEERSSSPYWTPVNSFTNGASIWTINRVWRSSPTEGKKFFTSPLWVSAIASLRPEIDGPDPEGIYRLVQSLHR
jgi:hypothetical protein